MDEANIEKIVILTGMWGEKLQGVLDKMVKPYPDRFIVFAQFDWSKINDVNFSAEMVAQLDDAVRRGARGLKVLKDLGLQVRDNSGKLVAIDDPRLDPVWEECGKLGIPVAIHSTDPEAFFTSVDNRNERYEELISNPSWSFYGPKYPSKETLLQERNHIVEKHPNTTFIALHLANWRKILMLSPVGCRSIPTCMWNLAPARQSLAASRCARASSLWIFRIASSSAQTVNRKKRPTQTIFAGWKRRTNIFRTPGILDRVVGKFMAWRCPTVFWKRSTTKTRRRFSRSSGVRNENASRGASNRARVIACLLLSGCRKTKDAQAPQLPAATSQVVVNISDDKITLRTSSAEFDLTKSGLLTGLLTGVNAKDSLDSSAVANSQNYLCSKKGIARRHAGFVQSPGQANLGETGPHWKTHRSLRPRPRKQFNRNAKSGYLRRVPESGSAVHRRAQFRSSDIALDWILLQRHAFLSALPSKAEPHPLWTFAGASLKWGKDEIFPMPAKFSQENPFGAAIPTGDDLGAVGGGIPVVAFWNRNSGAAIGHVETLPLTLSIPVKSDASGQVEAGVRVSADRVLKPGDSFSTPRTFFTVFRGDFYKPLSLWSKVVAKEGLSQPRNNDENYAVSWCGWGYEFGVTPKQMLDTIPKLKELGIHWATLDDGWFSNYGDWQPRSPVFAGDAIPDMVRKFHEQGIKLQLWWLPLAVEDGQNGYGGHKFVVSDVVKEHPDWLILNKEGKPARMARNLATLCPALPEVQAYYKQLTERFIRDWGFDGHKLDNIWSIPCATTQNNHHKSPSDSVNAMGDVYKIIFETTRALKPDSVTQSCPCGTPPNLAWLRYMDQAVTADPLAPSRCAGESKCTKPFSAPRPRFTAITWNSLVWLTPTPITNKIWETILLQPWAPAE